MLLLILLLPIISGCMSVKAPECPLPVFPPEPIRQHQELPETRDDFVRLVVYYEALVQEWEAWAHTVKHLIVLKPPSGAEN